MTEPRGLTLVAHVRRLASDGAILYIQIGAKDVRRLALESGQHVALDLGRVSISGIFKTSGSSAWLAPGDSTNREITESLRGAGFEHGNDVPAKVRLVGPPIVTADSRVKVSGQSVASPFLRAAPFRVDAAVAIEAVRAYNADSYRGRSNLEVDRIAYERFRSGLPRNQEDLIDVVRFVGEDYGGAQL